MRNTFWVGKRATLLSLFLCFFCNVWSQLSPDPKIETPNTASLEKFGDIPVDYFTGVPSVSVPIHTLKCGSISVPITLRYHSASVRVAQHPGWVGSGWDLESTGSITRKVNLYRDELYGSFLNGFVPYFPEPISSPPISGSELADVPNWSTTAQFKSYFSATGVNAIPVTVGDICADEFCFNFLGYSGKFYYVSPSKGWQVVCDQNIKVELTDPANPCITENGVLGYAANTYPLLYASEANTPQESATRIFKGFTLTTPDGTKYYFGGTDDNGTNVGIELSMSYGGIQFEGDSWLLTKIVDADSNKVVFTYSGKDATCDLSFGYLGSQNDQSCVEISNGPLSNNFLQSFTTGSLIGSHVHTGMLTFPLYLDKISSLAASSAPPNEIVNFTHSTIDASSYLRLPDAVLTYVDWQAQSPKFNLNVLGDGQWSAQLNRVIHGADNIQWEELTGISVMNGNNQPYRQFNFTYGGTPTSRITLASLSELDNIGNPVGKYSFDYYTPIPAQYDADFTDHWGFYNGKTVVGANTFVADTDPGGIYAQKTPNMSLASYGLLKTLYYPTGGHTILTWESHSYSQIVGTDRGGFGTDPSDYAGGARISEVQSFLADNTLALDKKFYYVRGYSTAGGYLNQTSSGTLNGKPSYHMDLGTRLGMLGTINVTAHLACLNSLAMYSYNGEGSYIGYDEVAEVNADGSYTRHFFTSFGPDKNNVSHWDIAPVVALGWTTADKYFPWSSLELERGKPVVIDKYTANDVLVEHTVNIYRSDAGRTDQYMKLINYGGSFAGCTHGDALVFATGNKVFTYDYYVTSQTTTTYDQQGKNPVSKATSYTYNTNNLVGTRIETDSKGESIVTTYSYPPDFTDVTSQAMTAAHILNPILQTSVTNNGNPVSLTKTTYYSPYPSRYKPQSVQMQFANNALETRQQFYQYDAVGNIAEVSKTNDLHTVYLWGYFQQYPVARIVGANLSLINTVLPNYQTQINNLTNTSGATVDASVRSLLQTLRTDSRLAGALVTTYTYLPLTGVTSETDPRGQTTFYQYDAFQRLKAITDNDGNIIKTFNYQYQVTN